MKMIFGLVGILIVLAIVGSLAKTQLKLFTGSTESAARVMNGSSAPTASPQQNARQQAADIQNQVRDRVNQNLQKGVERSDSSQQQ